MADLARPQAQKDSAAHKAAIQQPAAAEQELDASLVQNALSTVKAKADPRTVLQMQRMLGNRATVQMMGRQVQRAVAAPISAEQLSVVAPTVARREDDEASEELVDVAQQASPGEAVQLARTISPPRDVVQRDDDDDNEEVEEGPQVAADTGADTTKQIASAGITGTSLFGNIKAFFSSLANPEAATSGISAALSPFVSIFSILGISWAINQVRVSYNQMTGLESAKKSLATKTNLNADDKKLKASTEYGYAKVRRRFWGTVYKLVSSLIRTVMHFITLLSGGTAAMVSEGIAMGQSILDGLRVLFHKAKGFVKWLLGKRGKNRNQNANLIVDSALKGDKTALKLLADLDPIGTVGRQTRALKYGYGDPPQPTNAEEMAALLNTFKSNPEKFGSVDEFRHDTAVALKSQA